jgi:hypothetical protein
MTFEIKEFLDFLHCVKFQYIRRKKSKMYLSSNTALLKAQAERCPQLTPLDGLQAIRVSGRKEEKKKKRKRKKK